MQLPIHIVSNFDIEGHFVAKKPFGSGHINDTYLVDTTSGKYILQRINHSIFKNVEMMNRNIILALDHLNQKQLKNHNDRFKELNIILTKDGRNHYKDDKGNFWRMMNFISGSISFDVVDSTYVAYEGAKAFGYFQKNLIDLNPDDFFPVIEDFHNLELRMQKFLEIVTQDPCNRNQFALNEIENAKSHGHLNVKLKELLIGRQIPIRITHNDTKINNVLLDRETMKGIGVVDLDTVMPGTVLFDFGDMVRTFTSPATEDEKDLTKVVFRINIFKALAEGYLSELKDELTKTEKENLVFGGKVMTFMIGLRFLTDFLDGDVYYKTSRPNHNLDRCRTQFKLLSGIEQLEDDLIQLISEI